MELLVQTGCGLWQLYWQKITGILLVCRSILLTLWGLKITANTRMYILASFSINLSFSKQKNFSKKINSVRRFNKQKSGSEENLIPTHNQNNTRISY
jgi:hypothetical protein